MQAIAKHRPFKSTGDDFQTTNPLFAFYFYKYYISQIKPLYEQTQQPNAKTQLAAQIKQTFKTMTKLQAQSGRDPSDQVNMKAMLDYTQLMFAKNDHFHQEGHFTKQIAEDYLTIFRLYEVVKQFGTLDPNQNKRRIYSKKKFIDIMKQIKKNPAIQNASPAQVKKSVVPQLPPPPPVFKDEPKIQRIEQKIMKSQFNNPLPKMSKAINFDKIQMQIEANKCLENAISELSFDRFKYARDQVLHVLELLDQMIDN